jgi:cytochrome c553
MKTTSIILAAAVAATLGGCAVPERSRSLGNAAVPAKAIAQQVCSNCHGIDGNAASPNFPRLAAQPEPYLVAQLTYFRSRNRADPAGFEYMWGISRNLTDDHIKGLAAYFASQAPADNAPGEAQLSAEGKDIFYKGIAAKSVAPCATCHGEKAQGNLSFPRLAGQHADYVVKQLAVFQLTNERPAGVVMKTITHDLSPGEMAAVAQFVQGLPAK